MAQVGRKQVTYEERKQLFRKSPRDTRNYTGSTVLDYEELIASFNKNDYQLYERLLHAYKRVDPMMKYCVNRNITGPVLELAKIRANDQKTHQKLIQILRYQWTNTLEKRVKTFNSSPEKFWMQMSGRIQQRCQRDKLELYPDWEGPEGRIRLIDFLKKTYEEQNGLCAVSKTPMTLTIAIGSKNRSKCSPDRKNSNRGYTPDNLWLVSWWVNNMKMATPMNLFWKQIKILAEVKGLK